MKMTTRVNAYRWQINFRKEDFDEYEGFGFEPNLLVAAAKELLRKG